MSIQRFDKLAHFLATNAPKVPSAGPGMEEQILRRLLNEQKAEKTDKPSHRSFESSESGLVAALSLAAILALGLFVSLNGKRAHVSSITASEIIVEAVFDLQTEEDSDDLYEDWTTLASIASMTN